MNDPTPGAQPEQHGTPPGPRPVPGPPAHAPGRRPLGAPGPHLGQWVPASPPAVPLRTTPADAEGPADPPVDAESGPGAETGPGAEVEQGPGHAAPEVVDGPQPLGLRVEPTGHPPVDAQLRRLEDADHLAVSGHLEVYEDVHRGLRDALTALDRPDPHPHHHPRS